jgi:L,D-peptidoglycan transpeptidase YkuD (ErfK/YbiS/YcfS/YnhG family)
MPTPPMGYTPDMPAGPKPQLAFALSAIICMSVSLKSAPPEAARQLVLVIAADWSSSNATLYRLERSSPKDSWRMAGSPVAAKIGRTGFAWDQALPELPKEGPVKIEGDGKSPAGIFHFEKIYGTVPSGDRSVKQFRLPYQQIVPDLECVDDTSSAQYNRLVERSRVPSPDWHSSERISSLTDSVYRWLAVIDYNHNGARRGAGSCIFFHIASAQGKPTAGCTALEEGELLLLFRWLDPGRSPVIVQAAAGGLEILRRSHPELLERLPDLDRW